MILAGIIAFGAMLAAGFLTGCGLAELETWMKGREDDERTDKGHEDA